jgi:hypothetical protein
VTLFISEDDPFDDPLWQQALTMADAPPRPTKGYLTCSLYWLARVLPLVRSEVQLAVALLIYRKCLITRSRTVSLSNQEAQAIGISRYSKYRALIALREVGVVAPADTENGKSAAATLLIFP